jgi:mannose-6-phosphate isomerase-like protein (cupin superfamily)
MSKLNPEVIHFDDTDGFDRGDFQGQVYIPKEAELGFNALAVFVSGRHPRKRMGEGTTRTYLVVDGSGTFELDDIEQPVGRGDFITIPPDHEYAYEGKMTLFEINISPDNSFSDEKL